MKLYFYKIPIFLDSDAAWNDAKTWIVEAWMDIGAGINFYDAEVNIVPYVTQDADRYKDATPIMIQEVSDDMAMKLHTAVTLARQMHDFNKKIVLSVADLFNEI